MYWWNVSRLAEDLREGRVTEKERFKYYLATFLVVTVMTEPFLYYDAEFKITDVITAAIDAVALIIGTIVCYRANRDGDNADSIGRMICLSWPIVVRLFVLFLGVYGALIVLSSYSDMGNVIIGALFEICLYLLLYKYVKIVAQPKVAS